MQAGDLGFLTTTTVDFERKNTELFGRNELIIPFLFGPLKGRIPVELRMHRVSLLHSLIRYLHCHIQHVPRGLARLAHADCLHPARTLCCRRRRLFEVSGYFGKGDDDYVLSLFSSSDFLDIGSLCTRLVDQIDRKGEAKHTRLAWPARDATG
mgnify:CR=1 FL=1